MTTDRRVRLSIVLVLASAVSISSCRRKEEAKTGGSDLRFLEKTSTSGNKAGDPCSVSGTRARSSTSVRSVSVVDPSDGKIDVAEESVRVRKLRFPGNSIEPEEHMGPDESTPPPGLDLPSPDSLPFKGRYHILLAPVLSGFQAVIRHETRIVVVPSDAKGSDVRRAVLRIIENTPIGQRPSRYLTFAFLLSEESTTVPITELVGGDAKDKSNIALPAERLDHLLGDASEGSQTGGPTEGVMLEIDAPAAGLQTNTDKLLLWFEGKSSSFNVSGNLVCERQ